MIIPVLSKIDAPASRRDEVALELAELLDVDPDTVLAVSGRTGEGVEELLEAVIERVPAPRPSQDGARALIFDFSYSTHRGITVFARVFDGAPGPTLDRELRRVSGRERDVGRANDG